MATAEAVDFSVDRTSIRAGECVTFRWNVEGVKAVYFYSTGERWQDCGVAGVSQQQECPTKTDTYTLRIVKRDDSTIVRQITIEVQGATVEPPGPTPIEPPGPVPVEPPGPTPIEPPPPVETNLPVITEFTVTPDRIPAGGCVELRWSTAGGTFWVNIVRGEHIVWDNAPLSGSTQDCPEAPGTYNYRMVAFNRDDERVREDRTVTVG